MRRLFLLSVVLLVSAGMAFNQTVVVDDSFLDIESIRSQASAGLFDNELGAAVSVVEDERGPRFTELEHDYLFAGLGNLNEVEATDTHTGALFNPVLFGLYRTGESPWSLFSGVHVDGRGDRSTNVLTNDVQSETDGDVDWDWTRRHEVQETILREQFRVPVQYITALDGMNLGLRLHLQSTGGQRVRTQDDYFYNDADAGEEPDPQPAASGTTTERDGRNIGVGIEVPVFMGQGGFGQYLNPGVFVSWDATGSSRETEDWEFFDDLDPAHDPLNVTERDSRSRDVDLDMWAWLDYAMLMEPMFGENERNRFRIEAMLGTRYTTQLHSSEVTQTRMTFDGDDVDEGDTVTNVESWSYQGAFDLNLAGGASHSFYYDVGDDAEFAFRPGAGIGLSMEPLGPRTRLTFREREFEAPEEEVTEETEYAARDRRFSVSTDLELPVAFTAHPEDWIMGFTISGTPSVSHTWDIDRIYQQEEASFVRTVDGDVVTEEYYQEPKGRWETNHIWTFAADYALALHVPVTERAMLDVELAGGTDGSLFDLNQLTIQAIVGF